MSGLAVGSSSLLSARSRCIQTCVSAAAMILLAGLHRFWRRRADALGSVKQLGKVPPLRVAIFNHVNFHTHVVAGSLHVLQALTSAPVTVYLPKAVLQDNWYGFLDWLGKRTDVNWRLCGRYEQDHNEHYDVVWFISPEWDIDLTERVIRTLNPKMTLLYIHNGHMPQYDFDRLRALSSNMPLLTMAPHVARYVQQRLDARPAAEGASRAEWMIPTMKYQADRLHSQHQTQSLIGFSITGSVDKSLRNYDKMWQQIGSYREQHGPDALRNFKLNILGEMTEDFSVPGDLQEYVALYRTPPDPVFYDVISHSHALVPALANPQYYVSKLTSSAITSLMTGVPIIADDAFLRAYSMMEPAAVFRQGPEESELDVMFKVARLVPERILAVCTAVEQLQHKMNARALGLLLVWLLDRNLAPDPNSAAGKIR